MTLIHACDIRVKEEKKNKAENQSSGVITFMHDYLCAVIYRGSVSRYD